MERTQPPRLFDASNPAEGKKSLGCWVQVNPPEWKFCQNFLSGALTSTQPPIREIHARAEPPRKGRFSRTADCGGFANPPAAARVLKLARMLSARTNGFRPNHPYKGFANPPGARRRTHGLW